MDKNIENKKEDLSVAQQKLVIDKLVNHLSSLGDTMYYESTVNICHEIHNLIHNESLLNQNEKEAVIMLDARDIQTLLSYNSSC